MAKLLRLRDKFLLSLALAGDYILPTLLRAGRGLPPYKLYSWSGTAGEGRSYHKQTFHNQTWKLLNTGEIEKIIVEGKPVLRLTNKGKKRLIRDFPIFQLQKKKWNGYWCLVIFDFPEEKRSLRDFLREKLISLNFGRLQKSIYISPYDLVEDIAQFLNNKKLLGKAFVLKAQHRFMGDACKLADYVWKLGEFNKNYLNLLEKLEHLKEKKLIKKGEVSLLKQQFLELITKDPFLPVELLPVEWAREEVYKTIINLEI